MKAETVEKFGPSKLANLLHVINTLVPVIMASVCILYRDSIFMYTFCIGREEIFYVNLEVSYDCNIL